MLDHLLILTLTSCLAHSFHLMPANNMDQSTDNLIRCCHEKLIANHTLSNLAFCGYTVNRKMACLDTSGLTPEQTVDQEYCCYAWLFNDECYQRLVGEICTAEEHQAVAQASNKRIERITNQRCQMFPPEAPKCIPKPEAAQNGADPLTLCCYERMHNDLPMKTCVVSAMLNWRLNPAEWLAPVMSAKDACCITWAIEECLENAAESFCYQDENQQLKNVIDRYNQQLKQKCAKFRKGSVKCLPDKPRTTEFDLLSNMC